MRRSAPLLVLAAALFSAVPASADLRPVRRDFGELQLPRLRAGTVTVPKGHDRGRIRVIVRLASPPLARWSSDFRTTTASRRRLDVRGVSARAYLARLAREQRGAIADLRRAIPAATVSRRFRVLLNGLTVEVPVTALPRLVRQQFATRVYPSVRYRLATNQSPELVAAQTFAAATGARGEGVKIGVVDDGVDPTNPFFDPTGYAYPAGFPKGGTRWTTPKVIVARAYPGPGSGRGGRLAVDPRASFHGTHVAGIAAGNAGTEAPPGEDHPAVSGLSGVAPRAWIGNYRVFSIPTPIGHVANTPEIVAAFEGAVADGMDVINFSGGGPETDPANDAMIETVANVVAAGVVPVISAGNDRDEFGLGTAGSPGTAPEAISVAAVSNRQVFAPALTVPGAPAELERIPFQQARGTRIPPAWSSAQTLVDIGTIVGRDGRPVDRRLCGPPSNVNRGPNPLPPGSLRGAIALVQRGTCAFVVKAQRVRGAGGIGIVVVDNRPGEANPIPVELAVPGGMISDLDGRRLRELVLEPGGGRTEVRIGRDFERIETGRSGIVTSFSSAGPSAFGHRLKPDVAAPGGQILSATLRRFGGPFAVFDGTSMSAPHVTGAAALLLERHPQWTPRQVKSALVSTAGTAWWDTARTSEAPVVLEGGGLVNVARADDPKIFTAPSSLSFGDLNVKRGERSDALLVRIQDAGDGAGTWSVELHAQAAGAGTALELPAQVTVPPGGESVIAAIARASADAASGENYGFIVLRRAETTRRIPYLFLVTRPALENAHAVSLRRLQLGETLRGPSRVDRYRYPSAPFGPPPDYFGPPMDQDGAEKIYVTRLAQPAANFGVSVLLSSGSAVIDPWVLGSLDENDVQGVAGTPANANPLTVDYGLDVGAAGASFARAKTYYVSVDSGRDEFTGQRLAGRYLLRSWVNDVYPPQVAAVTRRVSAGRPTLVFRVVDGAFGEPASGVDPLSIVVAYRRVLVGAAAYDPISGLAVVPLPAEAPRLRPGTVPALVMASDYQETKNVNTAGKEIMPNTAFAAGALRVVNAPTVDWLAPERRECAERPRTRLAVVAGSPSRVRSVRFFDGRRRIATVRRGEAGLYGATWRTRGARKGRHLLRAVVADARGRTASAERVVRIC